jgi:hypothetical protein|nr:MAG TPA: PORTAL PROTEIN [Caudoviricetes sp.]
MTISEEAKVIEAENSTVVLSAFNRIPYGLINEEVSGYTNDVLTELTQICGYYKIYKDGASFITEGSNGDYIPSNLSYKMAASLINKEARFLFADAPDITITTKGDLGKASDEAKNQITVMSDLVKTVLDANKFEQQLVKAARDCFIGKRVACLINFNEEDGITVVFLPSTQFLYEMNVGNTKLTKFVAFIIVKDSIKLSEKRIFKKKYELEHKLDGTDTVYLEEQLYDGAGRLLDDVTKRQAILLDKIPAVVILNDGLTGDDDGESEIEILKGYESWYSKLSNADIDSERKSMNQIKYTIDMDSNSTKELSTAPGAFWDLGSDQNLDNPSPSVGTINPDTSYSAALQSSLDRIKSTGYDQVDMPDVNLQTMSGAITSGKALKAIYWPLIIRCKEKMKTWGPQLEAVVSIIIDGSIVYPNCVKRYTDDFLVSTAYEVDVEQNIPIPDDEVEEKNVNLAEVAAQVMSRKSYMKKWYQLTDDEVSEELKQIAIERQILEEASFPMNGENVPYPKADDIGEPVKSQMGGAFTDEEEETEEDTDVDDDIEDISMN